jgi:hypothetical protein
MRPFNSLLIFLLLITNAYALTPKELKTIQQPWGHSDLIQDKKIFDGKNITKNITEKQFTEYKNKWTKQYSLALKNWNSQSKKNKNDPKLKEIAAQVAKCELWNKALSSVKLAAPTISEDKATVNTKIDPTKSTCQDFLNKVMTPKTKDIFKGLLTFDKTRMISLSEAELILSSASAVQEACRNQYNAISNNDCGAASKESSPKDLCQAATNGREIVKKQLLNKVYQELSEWNNRPLIKSNLKGDQKLPFFANAVPDNDGWRDISNWQEMNFNPAQKQIIIKKYEGIKKLLDNFLEDKEIITPVENAFIALRDDAMKSLKKWSVATMPQSSDYLVKLASDQFNRFPNKGKIYQVFLDNSGWESQKSPEGKVIKKTHKGMMLYSLTNQIPCQMVKFTAEELPGPGNKFQPALKVLWGQVRFQQCPTK